MEDLEKITELRGVIDKIDEEIVALLNKRAQVSLRIRVAKGNSSIYRPEREAEVIRHVTERSQGPLSTEAIGMLFHSIIFVCRTIQQADFPDDAPLSAA